MKITREEVETALVKAAPSEGKSWEPGVIAQQLVNLVEEEAEQERRDREDWEVGRQQFGVRFAESDVPKGNPAAIDAHQAEAQAKHRAFIQQRLARNRELISGIGASIVALGTTALTGGASTPVLVAGAMSIARQIADALNDTSA